MLLQAEADRRVNQALATYKQKYEAGPEESPVADNDNSQHMADNEGSDGNE